MDRERADGSGGMDMRLGDDAGDKRRGGTEVGAWLEAEVGGDVGEGEGENGEDEVAGAPEPRVRKTGMTAEEMMEEMMESGEREFWVLGRFLGDLAGIVETAARLGCATRVAAEIGRHPYEAERWAICKLYQVWKGDRWPQPTPLVEVFAEPKTIEPQPNADGYGWLTKEDMFGEA